MSVAKPAGLERLRVELKPHYDITDSPLVPRTGGKDVEGKVLNILLRCAFRGLGVGSGSESLRAGARADADLRFQERDGGW